MSDQFYSINTECSINDQSYPDYGDDIDDIFLENYSPHNFYSENLELFEKRVRVFKELLIESGLAERTANNYISIIRSNRTPIRKSIIILCFSLGYGIKETNNVLMKYYGFESLHARWYEDQIFEFYLKDNTTDTCIENCRKALDLIGKFKVKFDNSSKNQGFSINTFDFSKKMNFNTEEDLLSFYSNNEAVHYFGKNCNTQINIYHERLALVLFGWIFSHFIDGYVMIFDLKAAKAIKKDNTDAFETCSKLIDLINTILSPYNRYIKGLKDKKGVEFEKGWAVLRSKLYGMFKICEENQNVYNYWYENKIQYADVFDSLYNDKTHSTSKKNTEYHTKNKNDYQVIKERFIKNSLNFRCLIDLFNIPINLFKPQPEVVFDIEDECCVNKYILNASLNGKYISVNCNTLFDLIFLLLPISKPSIIDSTDLSSSEIDSSLLNSLKNNLFSYNEEQNFKLLFTPNNKKYCVPRDMLAFVCYASVVYESRYSFDNVNGKFKELDGEKLMVTANSEKTKIDNILNQCGSRWLNPHNPLEYLLISSLYNTHPFDFLAMYFEEMLK